MEFERSLKEYKKQMSIKPSEENILETIQKSKEIFIRQEEGQAINYFEFMVVQLQLLRKRWWVLQTALLGLVAVVLPYMQDRRYMLRVLGTAAVLFVIMTIPEFWKNKACDCMQIEGACLYSVRQIYAVRMFLFGIVDLAMLTCFCIYVRGNLYLAVSELLVQFLFPMTVAACICFGTLCSNKCWNETAAIMLCLLWSALWCMIVMNEAVYMMISFPMWCVLFGFSIAFLLGAAYKTIRDCNIYQEGDFNEAANG